MRQGCVYSLNCLDCKIEGKKTLYYGESACTPFDRGLNHADMIRRGDESHPMVNHYLEAHPNQEIHCQMKIEKFEQKNMYRQAWEGLKIANFKGGTLLNSRGDWGQNLPPVLTTEGFEEEKKRKLKFGQKLPPRKKKRTKIQNF